MNTAVKPIRGTHLIAPAAVMAVVLLMIVPLPPMLLDLLLSMDIGLSVVLLLTVIYVRQPVEFSVFPSLLLLLTLLDIAQYIGKPLVLGDRCMRHPLVLVEHRIG